MLKRACVCVLVCETEAEGIQRKRKSTIENSDLDGLRARRTKKMSFRFKKKENNDIDDDDDNNNSTKRINCATTIASCIYIYCDFCHFA